MHKMTEFLMCVCSFVISFPLTHKYFSVYSVLYLTIIIAAVRQSILEIIACVRSSSALDFYCM